MVVAAPTGASAVDAVFVTHGPISTTKQHDKVHRTLGQEICAIAALAPHGLAVREATVAEGREPPPDIEADGVVGGVHLDGRKPCPTAHLLQGVHQPGADPAPPGRAERVQHHQVQFVGADREHRHALRPPGTLTHQQVLVRVHALDRHHGPAEEAILEAHAAHPRRQQVGEAQAARRALGDAHGDARQPRAVLQAQQVQARATAISTADLEHLRTLLSNAIDAGTALVKSDLLGDRKWFAYLRRNVDFVSDCHQVVLTELIQI